MVEKIFQSTTAQQSMHLILRHGFASQDRLVGRLRRPRPGCRACQVTAQACALKGYIP